MASYDETATITFGAEVCEYLLASVFLSYQYTTLYSTKKKHSVLHFYFYLSLLLCCIRIIKEVLAILKSYILIRNIGSTIIYALDVNILSIYSIFWYFIFRNRKYIQYSLDLSLSERISLLLRENLLIILLNILTYCGMLAIISLLYIGELTSVHNIYLDNGYLLIYRFIPKLVICIYVFVVGVRLLRQINQYSMLKPTKLVCSICLILFTMVSTILFHIALTAISLGKGEQKFSLWVNLVGNNICEIISIVLLSSNLQFIKDYSKTFYPSVGYAETFNTRGLKSTYSILKSMMSNEYNNNTTL